MPKITAGTSVKAALLAAFPFLVGINGTEESLHEYLAIFVLLIAVQHLLKQKWWFRMMRFGLRNQPLKLKMTAVFLFQLCADSVAVQLYRFWQERFQPKIEFMAIHIDIEPLIMANQLIF